MRLLLHDPLSPAAIETSGGAAKGSLSVGHCRRWGQVIRRWLLWSLADTLLAGELEAYNLGKWAVGLPNSVEDFMEHKTRNQIRDVADILPTYLRTDPLSKRERLELWAEALERQGVRRLRTLFEIEYLPAA